MGNLGHALMQNFPFADIGFSLDAAFDVSPAMIGTTVNGVDVRSLDELDGYCAGHLPDVAILTVPRSAAQSTVDRLVGLGIRGFWNFTNKEVTSDRRRPGGERPLCRQPPHPELPHHKAVNAPVPPRRRPRKERSYQKSAGPFERTPAENAPRGRRRIQ